MTRLVSIPITCVLLAVLAGAGNALADKLDPDQAAKAAADVNLSLVTIKSGEYELIVQNQSGLGSIDSFAWVPGPGWTVTVVLGASPGKCIVNDGAISCTGKITAPKQCTCQPGGRMTITFRMSRPRGPGAKKNGAFVGGTAGSYLIVKTVTFVHRHIPTELPSPNE